MSRAIDELMHDHETILSALDILGRMDRAVTAGTPVDPQDIKAFIRFLREFADECHHGKEEGLLFPALVAAGMPERGGPVGVMLDEHVEGRRWIADMEAAAKPALKAAEFTRSARGYSQLLRAHIQKENQVLFMMAERILPPGELDELADAFAAHEARVMGAGRHEELHALIESLRAKYAGEAVGA
jgi:hemerythrin-like domain-containing protein